MSKQVKQIADSGTVRIGGYSPPVAKPTTVKETKKIADAGKVRLGGYSAPVAKPAVKDAKKVRLGAMSPAL